MSACTTAPFWHQNKPPRESIFCGKVSGWWTKMVLTMLKFLLKVRQRDYAACTREWATAQRTRAFATASASGCRACCHGQRRQHHANAEVICHRQPSSQLIENVWNNFRQGRFLKHSHVLPQTNGATFLVLSYLCPGTSYMSGVSILVFTV